MKVRITAIRQTEYPDLMAKYENLIEHTCDVTEASNGSPLTASSPKECVLLHGTPCGSSWSH